MIVTCPKCFSADDVTYLRLPDRLISYTCARRHEDGQAHTWILTKQDVLIHDDAGDGVTDELLEPLSNCVVLGEPYVEYGVVEYRLRERYPELFFAHVREQGHHLVPGHRQATASSVRFGTALGRLARGGELLSKYGRATGAWSYNGSVTYWVKPPQPSSPDLTWEQFCVDIGRSPQWTDKDREGLV